MKVKSFNHSDTATLKEVKEQFFAHFSYLKHKNFLDRVWKMFVLDNERFAMFEAGEWVEIPDSDYVVALDQETGEIKWNYSEAAQAEQWARELDATEDLFEKAEQDAFNRLSEVAAAEFGVKIIKTECGWTWAKDVEIPDVEISATAGGKTIRMFTCTKKGGLHEEGSLVELLPPWEFSLAKYSQPSQEAAAREYVRRKLKKFAKGAN